jgi:small subunit ribosomal protein S21
VVRENSDIDNPNENTKIAKKSTRGRENIFDKNLKDLLDFVSRKSIFADIFNKKRRKYMLIISIKENESIDKALKRFKKKFEKTGVVKELRRRSAFEKPSISRRTELIRASYKQRTYGNINN